MTYMTAAVFICNGSLWTCDMYRVPELKSKLVGVGGEEEACDWLRPPRLAPPLPNPRLRSGAAYDSYNIVCCTPKDCLPPPLDPRLRSMTAYMNLQYLLKFSPFSVGGSKPTYAVLFTPRPYKTCYI